MIPGQKNAPSLADRGKSTFSEGGGDNSSCLEKHGCSNYRAIYAAVPQLMRENMQRIVNFLALKLFGSWRMGALYNR